MWEKIMEVGQEFKIQPYGTEALSTLELKWDTLQDLS
jgi:sarcosine oxidase subunit alpha